MLVQAQKFYERFTGCKHVIDILFCGERQYEVRVDNEFYTTAENKGEAFDEVADIIKNNNWSSICVI